MPSWQAMEALLDENVNTSAPLSSLEEMLRPYQTQNSVSIAVFGGQNVISVPSSLPYLQHRRIVGTDSVVLHNTVIVHVDAGEHEYALHRGCDSVPAETSVVEWEVLRASSINSAASH